MELQMKTPASLRKPVLATLVVALGAALLPAQAFAADEAQWVPGRLLVQPRAGLSETEFDKIIKKQGGKQVGKIEGINVRIIQLPPQASEKAVEALLKKNKHLKFAERDMIVAHDSTNDPYYSKAWHIPKIGAPTAWPTSTGSGVAIAILDSGVDSAHPDLAGKLLPGWNFYDGNSNTADVTGHGTKVAGTAAAASNNALGVASIAGGAMILPGRVGSPTGSASYSTMAAGVTWAADKGARVANLSYGGARGSATVQSAAQYLKNKGGLLVTSGGNDGIEEAVAPSDTLIAVSATTSSDVKASWSSYGNYIDVAAPGSGIYTTTNGGGYASVSGTSFASPATAAVVALMMAANPKLAPDDIAKHLFATAVDLGTAGFDKYYGHGRIDAAAAVQAAVAATASDTSAPTVSVSNPTAGATVSGLVPVGVSASDNVGVVRTELWVNSALVATDITSPYAFSWDSTGVPDGNVTLTARAYDAAGNYGSRAVTVSVANALLTSDAEKAVADTVAPKASLSNPTEGMTLSATKVTVSGAGADDVGVVELRLYVDGKLETKVSGSKLSYSLNTRKLSTGAHTIALEAVDAAGNSGVASVSVRR
jgi:subtilisin family serine protease